MRHTKSTLKAFATLLFITLFALAFQKSAAAFEEASSLCHLVDQGFHVVVLHITANPTCTITENLGLPRSEVIATVEQGLSPGSGFLVGTVVAVRTLGCQNVPEAINRILAFQSGKHAAAAIRQISGSFFMSYGMGGATSGEVNESNQSLVVDPHSIFPRGSTVQPFSCAPPVPDTDFDVINTELAEPQAAHK